MIKTLLTFFICGLAVEGLLGQSVIANGDFSNGLNNWMVVQPPGYEVITGTVAQIEFGGQTNVSTAFSAHVGAVTPEVLEQTVTLLGGVEYVFYADAAAVYPQFNSDGGTIRVFLGSYQLVAWISFGGGSGTKYNILEGTYTPDRSGDQTLMIDFERIYFASDQSPTDYIGNISLEVVPEPSFFALVGIGASSLYMIRQRRALRHKPRMD